VKLGTKNLNLTNVSPIQADQPARRKILKQLGVLTKRYLNTFTQIGLNTQLPKSHKLIRIKNKRNQQAESKSQCLRVLKEVSQEQQDYKKMSLLISNKRRICLRV
jgi:hypothetical protein